jgi:hypothetical protein
VVHNAPDRINTLLKNHRAVIPPPFPRGGSGKESVFLSELRRREFFNKQLIWLDKTGLPCKITTGKGGFPDAQLKSHVERQGV